MFLVVTYVRAGCCPRCFLAGFVLGHTGGNANKEGRKGEDNKKVQRDSQPGRKNVDNAGRCVVGGESGMILHRPEGKGR